MYTDLSWLEWRLGAYVSAELMCKRALDLTKPWDDSFNTHWIYNNLGAIHFLQGQYKSARDAYTTALKTIHASKNTDAQALFLVNLAEVELHLGLLDEAHKNLQNAAVCLAKTPNNITEATVHWYFGELLAIRGATTEAQAKYVQAFDCAHAAGLFEREAESLARLGRLKKDPSITKRALVIFDTLAIRASVIAVSGDYQSAINLLREAGSIYEEMRLAADLIHISGDPAWLLETQRLLEKLRNTTSETNDRTIRP